MHTPDDARTGPVIALADDHPIVRAALKAALADLGEGTRFVEADDADSVMRMVGNQADLDLLLIDLHMPGVRGIETVRAVRQLAPTLPVAVMSAHEDAATVAQLLHLGVGGFIPKSDPASVIVGAVRLILAGGTYVPPRLVHAAQSFPKSGNGAATQDTHGLTSRQLEVLRLLRQGLPNKVIARDLGISEGTVKVHLLAVFRALNVRNRTAAVLAAQRYPD